MSEQWKVFSINSWAQPIGFGLWRVSARSGRNRLVLGKQRAERLMLAWSVTRQRGA